MVVDSEILASITDEFYANGIGLIYDDGVGGKWLLAVAALPLQGREEGVFTRYHFKLPLSGQDEGVVINFNPDDHVTPTELKAAIAGHGHQNAIINGCARVGQGSDYTLVKDAYAFGKVDRWEGMATGDTVVAGVLTQKTDSGLSRNGFSLYFSGVTLTGTGILYLRHRIFSTDAKHFKNQKASFSNRVLHDVGAGDRNYTVFVRKANALDDFSSVTEIAASGVQSIGNGVESDLKFENIDMGDCSNGIEVEIKVIVGVITTRGFEFAELQFEIGTVATAFDLRPIAEELSLCQRGLYAVDTGVADAYAADFEPKLVRHPIGIPLTVKMINANTGACTFNPNGLGAVNMNNLLGDNLIEGDILANSFVVLIYDGTNYLVTNLPPASVSVWDISRNLVIKNNRTNPDYQMDVDANEIILQDSNGRPYRVTNVNLTIDLTVFGANGLDSGIEANLTWYYIWAIYNPTTNTKAGVFSQSASGPNMPSGYTYKALLSANYNDVSYNFISIYQRDKRVVRPVVNVLTDGGATSYTVLDLSAIVPVQSKVVHGSMSINPNVAGVSSVFLAADSDGLGEKRTLTGNNSDSFGGSAFGMLMIEDQKIYYKVSNASNDADVDISGWEY